MPRMDGFELLRALRSDPATATIPILMLSARAGEEAESKASRPAPTTIWSSPSPPANSSPASPPTSPCSASAQELDRQRTRAAHQSRKRRARNIAPSSKASPRALSSSIATGASATPTPGRRHGAPSIPRVLIGKSLWDVVPRLAEPPFGRAFRRPWKPARSPSSEDFYRALAALDSRHCLSLARRPLPLRSGRHRARIQQEKLLAQEKLAATGRLAATIAHEINNPLESVLNLIYLARTSRTEIAKIREYLDTAEKELTRVSHIARHTLGFYRETSAPRRLDLPALLEEVLTVYDSRLRAAVHRSPSRLLHRSQPSAPCAASSTRSSPTSSPMPSMPCATAAASPSPSVRPFARRRRGGHHLRDTGIGIPQENIPRLFEPFFTTKPSAGTGLGLWVVRQFVTSWKGAIDVTSDNRPRTPWHDIHTDAPPGRRISKPWQAGQNAPAPHVISS